MVAKLWSHRARTLGSGLAVLATAASISLMPVHAPSASAEWKSGSANLFASELYVYVNAAETLQLTAINTTAHAPDGSIVTPTCVGQVCTYSSLTSGVWWLQNTSNVLGQVWDVAVKNGTTEITGRVWSDAWTFDTGGYRNETFSLFYLSPFGALYSATYTNFRGWNYEFRANSIGLTTGSTCRPSYLSARYSQVIDSPSPSGTADLTLSDAACTATSAVRYRIFLSQPDPGMPATASSWGDSRTANRWVNPTFTNPEIQSVSYTRSSATGIAGTVSGTLVGQPGVLSVDIDTNANGSYADAVDVRLTPTATAIGAFTFPWNGIDGSGAAVPNSRTVTARVSYSGNSEIHLLLRDVEGLGGVRVTRLTGPGAPDTLASWNDTRPAADTTYTLTAPTTANATDSTTATRSWSFTPGVSLSLGDTAYIDTWASIPFVPAPVAVSVPGVPVVTTPPVTPPTNSVAPTKVLAKTGSDVGPALAALAALAAGAGLLLGRRRLRRG